MDPPLKSLMVAFFFLCPCQIPTKGRSFPTRRPQGRLGLMRPFSFYRSFCMVDAVYVFYAKAEAQLHRSFLRFPWLFFCPFFSFQVFRDWRATRRIHFPGFHIVFPPSIFPKRLSPPNPNTREIPLLKSFLQSFFSGFFFFFFLFPLLFCCLKSGPPTFLSPRWYNRSAGWEVSLFSTEFFFFTTTLGVPCLAPQVLTHLSFRRILGG